MKTAVLTLMLLVALLLVAMPVVAVASGRLVGSQTVCQYGNCQRLCVYSDGSTVVVPGYAQCPFVR